MFLIQSWKRINSTLKNPMNSVPSRGPVPFVNCRTKIQVPVFETMERRIGRGLES